MHTRIDMLRKLVSWEIVDIPEVDSDSQETILLRGSHIEKMLSRYMLWEIESEFLEEWANLVESREDIVYEEKNKSIITEVLHLCSSQDFKVKVSKSYIQAIFLAIE